MREPPRLMVSGSHLSRELLNDASSEVAPDEVRSRALSAIGVGAAGAGLTLLSNVASASVMASSPAGKGAAAEAASGGSTLTASGGTFTASGGTFTASGGTFTASGGSTLTAAGTAASKAGTLGIVSFSFKAAGVIAALGFGGLGVHLAGSDVISPVTGAHSVAGPDETATHSRQAQVVQMSHLSNERESARRKLGTAQSFPTAPPQAVELGLAAADPSQAPELGVIEPSDSEGTSGAGSEGTSGAGFEGTSVEIFNGPAEAPSEPQGAPKPRADVLNETTSPPTKSKGASVKLRTRHAQGLRPKRVGVPVQGTDAELHMLAQARELMKQGHSSQVLGVVEEYRSRFPRGLFRPEMNMLSEKARRSASGVKK